MKNVYFALILFIATSTAVWEQPEGDAQNSGNDYFQQRSETWRTIIQRELPTTNGNCSLRAFDDGIAYVVCDGLTQNSILAGFVAPGELTLWSFLDF